MNPLITAIASALIKELWPKLKPLIEAELAKISPELLGLVEAKFSEWLPKLTRVVVVAVAQAAGQITVDSADKVTDIIPGKIDDAVIDPIVRNVFDQLGRLFG